MKKRLTVKQKNILDQSISVLHDGECECNRTHTQIILHYQENMADGTVELEANDEMLIIKRNAETQTRLLFRKGQKTTGMITSQYGSFEIELFTHFYQVRGNIIAIEYDVLSGADRTSFRFTWQIQELFA